jgi:hypothetical protein
VANTFFSLVYRFYYLSNMISIEKVIIVSSLPLSAKQSRNSAGPITKSQVPLSRTACCLGALEYILGNSYRLEPICRGRMLVVPLKESSQIIRVFFAKKK